MPDTSDANPRRVKHEWHKCNMSEIRATRVWRKCNTSATQTTRVRHECYTNDTSVTRVLHEWKSFDFDNTRAKTYFRISIFIIWQVKDYKDRSNLILSTTFGNVSFPCRNAFEKYTTKTGLCKYSNAASFSIKTILCENTNILFSKNYWKLGKMNARFSKNI